MDGLLEWVGGWMDGAHLHHWNWAHNGMLVELLLIYAELALGHDSILEGISTLKATVKIPAY